MIALMLPVSVCDWMWSAAVCVCVCKGGAQLY